MSGSVDRKIGRLDYEVSLYREVEGDSNVENMEEAVPIGTRLQLRVKLADNSIWRHVKLLEVILSPSKEEPRTSGHVTLLEGGCRVEEFEGIMPKEPWVPDNTTGEARMEFEAVMLDFNRGATSRIWVHARTIACQTREFCTQV